MRLLSDNEFIINNINNNNNIAIVDINVIILLYKIFAKCVNEIIKRKRRSCDIYNNLEFML